MTRSKTFQPGAFQYDTWSSKTAAIAFPILVWCAKNGKTISYGRLDKEIIARGLGHHVHAAQYGHAAGLIGDALIETEQNYEFDTPIPPINALVVNAMTGVPGKGVEQYLTRYRQITYTDLSEQEKKSLIAEIHEDIFNFPHWEYILKLYGQKELDGLLITDEVSSDNVAPPNRGGWSTEGESDHHRKLKEFVAKNPALIGLPKNSKHGLLEYQFASADRADIVFQTKTSFVGVEVKSIISNDADLNRGIFQAIKYQALLRAEQKAANYPPTAYAILVTERKLPIELQNLADLLGVQVINIICNKV